MHKISIVSWNRRKDFQTKVTSKCSWFHPSLLTPPLSYTLNTCVDPPHDQKVTSLIFQPKRPPQKAAAREDCNKDPQPGTLVPQMAVSTSLDGRFKTWIVVDAKREKKSKPLSPSWACRSVGYYHSLPCIEAAFCEDGSLLGLNFCKVQCIPSTTSKPCIPSFVL